MSTKNSKDLTKKPKDSIIIFHRSKQNPGEDLKNQKDFLDLHKNKIPKHVKIIDYMSSSGHNGTFKVLHNANCKLEIPTNPSSFLSFLRRQESKICL